METAAAAAVPGGEGAVKEGFLEEVAWGGLGKGQSALRAQSRVWAQNPGQLLRRRMKRRTWGGRGTTVQSLTDRHRTRVPRRGEPTRFCLCTDPAHFPRNQPVPHPQARAFSSQS